MNPQELQVTPDQLLQEIGRLTVANRILMGQLAASRQEVIRLNGVIAEQSADQPKEN